jgi:hypothetical protein
MIMWLTAVAFFGFRHLWMTKIVNKHDKIKKYGWPIPLLMLIVAAWSLLLAPIPFFGLGSIAELAGGILKWIVGFLVGIFHGGSGVVALIATLALIFVLIAAVCDLWDKDPESYVKTAIWTVPILSLISAAPIAVTLLAKVHQMQSWGTAFITSLG